jgi:hypothetical protein
MRGKWLLVTVILLGLMLGAVVGLSLAQGVGSEDGAAPQALVGTAFTYQGRLNKGGSPYTGQCDFRFSLHDALSDGNQVGNTQTLAGVDVDAGLFTVALNSGGQFGDSAFNGQARWLKIQVQCAGDGSYTPLEPRQALTPAPYALALPGLWTQPNTTSPNLIGGCWGNEVTAGVVGATISGGGNVDNPNRVTADYATVGGGYANDANAIYAAVGGGYGNDASGDYATVGGGRINDASGTYATVGGGRFNDASNYYATISGGYYNAASGEYATVGGGDSNAASGDYATVGGGDNNHASVWAATVGGGKGNEASGYAATVGGGYGNASVTRATVGGGDNNHAIGLAATIGGGWSNDASNGYATVPGGRDNEASGYYSFAAGYRAKANHDGSFVLADSTEADFTSVREDALRVRFNGGATFVVNDGHWVRFWSNAGHLIDTSTDAHLTTGGVWTNGSDREAKENFSPVDGPAVLARLAAVPIQTWNYKAEDPAVRRMGPTAQDFYAAFGLGEDERHISTLDADGVALAAIQGLYEQVQALQAENADLEARVAALEAAYQGGSLSGPVSRSSPWQAGLLPVGGLLAFGVVWLARRGGVR